MGREIRCILTDCRTLGFIFCLVIAVYGLVVSVLIAGSRMSTSSLLSVNFLPAVMLIGCLFVAAPSIVSPSEPYSLFGGFIHLGAGLGEFTL